MFGEKIDMKIAVLGILFMIWVMISTALEYGNVSVPDLFPKDPAGWVTQEQWERELEGSTPKPNSNFPSSSIYKELEKETVEVDVKPLPIHKRKSFLSTLINKYHGVDKRELIALSVAIYCESRGESLYGMKAVADTIRNRVHSKHFPNSYYGVVTQPHQFSCIIHKDDLENNIVIRGTKDKKILKRIVKIAYRTITGKMPRMTYNALFYHTVETKPYWSKKYDKLGVVDRHIFYTTKQL